MITQDEITERRNTQAYHEQGQDTYTEWIGGQGIESQTTEDGEEAWNKMKNAVKVSLYKPELLKVHNIAGDSEFDFRKYFTEYTMDKPELMEQMKKAALQIPDSVARSAIGVGSPDDVIEMLERFIRAGTNHFIIRFWGDGYFKNIEMFGKKVIPYFHDRKKK